jgi:Flp pilus assembly protein TadG
VSKSEAGNAVVEFVAFGFLLLAPLALTATELTAARLDKQVASSAATQLARSYTLGQHQFLELEGTYRAKFPKLQIATSQKPCCIEVAVTLNSAHEVARQVF